MRILDQKKKKYKSYFIVCLLSVFIITVFIFFSLTTSRMDDYHAQVKKYFLAQLQQAIDNNEDRISYRTDQYQLNGVEYHGEIYVVNTMNDIKYVKDILSHCKALKEVRHCKTTNIGVFVGGINIGCTGAYGDYFWSMEEGKAVGFYLPEKYNKKLWEFLKSLDYQGH